MTLMQSYQQLYKSVEPLAVQVLGKKCANSLFAKLDYTDAACAKLLVSKGLSFGIIAGSVLVKVPQIVQIAAARSGRGVSRTSYWIETAAFSIFCAYNYRAANPFTTYGEGLFIAVQNMVILALLHAFSPRGSLWSFAPRAVLFAAFAYALLDPRWVSASHLAWLQGLNVLLTIGSKLPQIFANWRAGSIGQLSRTTVFLTCVGSLARVFTTYKEVDDQLLLVGTVVAAALNVVLLLQAVRYRASPKGGAAARKRAPSAKKPKKN